MIALALDIFKISYFKDVLNVLILVTVSNVLMISFAVNVHIFCI